jgi:peptidoglycan-associated lipoprotein
MKSHPPDRLYVLFVSLCGGAAMAAGGCAHDEKATPESPRPAVTARAARPARAEAPPRAPDQSTVADTSKGGKENAVYFDFDSALLRDDARPVLQKLAETAQERQETLRIEGNCDEVGTTEYNLALGEQRAREAKQYLVRLGVSPSRITTISYGAQRPKAQGHDETAHAENRRDDLVLR